jgi:hypothetical protein
LKFITGGTRSMGAASGDTTANSAPPGGRRDVARELLVPIYGWFTEGFETPDLVKGKVLPAR